MNPTLGKIRSLIDINFGQKALQVSLTITHLVGSIGLNRIMGDARYSFCRDWSGCTLPSAVRVGGEAPVFGCFPRIYE